MKKVLALIISSLFLTACDDDETVRDDNIATPTLAEIAGVWDIGDAVELDIDYISDAYYVITEDGEFKVYAQMEYVGIDLCYVNDSDYDGTITDLGGGEFEVYVDGESSTDSYSIVDGQLTIESKIDGDYIEISSTSLQESDLKPLCSAFGY